MYLNNNTKRIRNKNKNKNTKRIRNENKIKNRRKSSVIFGHVYSNGCGHCINMQGEWDKVCDRLKQKHILHDIGDDYENKISQFNQKYNTNLSYTGFPTIFRLRKNSKPIEYYNGERQMKPMLKWIIYG